MQENLKKNEEIFTNTEEIKVNWKYAELLENHPNYKKLKEGKNSKIEVLSGKVKNNKKVEEIEEDNVQIEVLGRKVKERRLKLSASTKIKLTSTKLSVLSELDEKKFYSFLDPELAEMFKKDDKVFLKEISYLENNMDCKIFPYMNYIFIFAAQNELKDIETMILEVKNIVSKSYVHFTNSENGFDLTSNLYEVVRKYLAVGAQLSTTSEVSHFKNLVHSLYNAKNPFDQLQCGKAQNECRRYSDLVTCDCCVFKSQDLVNWQYTNDKISFIFVCASSGTGKTQLPFSLDIPLIYLIFNKNMITKWKEKNDVAEIQGIYTQYLPLSKCFMDCVDQDMKFLLAHEINKENVKKDNSDLDLPDDSTPFFLVGFLIAVYEKMAELRKTFNEELWIVTQLRIPELTIQKMSVINGRKKILEISNDIDKDKSQTRHPVIFFDECINMESQKENIRTYKYVRRLIRSMAIISTFMGTNANISNFVTKEISAESRTDLPKTWCWIFFRLSPVSEDFLKTSKEECIKLISEKRTIYDFDRLKVMAFLNHIFESMKTERPLFCHYIFKYFRKILVEDLFKEFDEKKYFMELLNFLFTSFTSRKKNFADFKDRACSIFSFSNLQMMAPEYWRKKVSEKQCQEKQCKQCKQCLEKNAGIHGHIADLFVESIVEKEIGNFNYFGINPSEGNSYSYIGEFEKKKISINFKTEQIFKQFKIEPFGQLMFTASEGYEKLFIQKNKETIKRISSSKYILENDNLLLNNLEMNLAQKWALFESAISMAALVATFSKSFNGSSFEEWLSKFLFEIKFTDKRDALISSDKTFELFSQINIPYCAPSLKAEWPENFAKYFVEECKASIGTVDASLGNEPHDFNIKKLKKKEEESPVKNCQDSTIKKLKREKVDASLGNSSHDSNIKLLNKEIILSGECKTRSAGLQPGELISIIKKLDSLNSPLNLIVCTGLSSTACLENLKNSPSCSKDKDFFKNKYIYYAKKGEPLVMKKICTEETVDSSANKTNDLAIIEDKLAKNEISTIEIGDKLAKTKLSHAEIDNTLANTTNSPSEIGEIKKLFLIIDKVWF